MIRTLALLLGAALWGALVFFVGLRANFPGDAALDRVRWELQQATDGEMALDAASVRPWRFTGLSFREPVLYKLEKPKKSRKKKRRRNGDEGEEPAAGPAPRAVPVARADEVSARIALIPLIRGMRVFDFSADLFGGALSGSAGGNDARMHVDLSGRDLDLSRMPIEGDEWRVEARGVATLDADVVFDKDDFKASTGEGALRIEGLKVDRATIFGIDLPGATFTEAVLEFEIDKGKANITNGQFASDLFDATLSGEATIANKSVSRWRLRVDVKATLQETMDAMLKNLPRIKEARDPEGVYHFLCTGTLGSPHCREDRIGAGNLPGPSRTNPRRMGDDEPEGEEGDRLDPDEQREKRLERIRERREKLRKEREAARAGGEIETEGADTPRRGRLGGRLPRPELGEGDPMDDEMGRLPDEDEPMFDEEPPLDRPLDGEPPMEMPPEQFEE